MSYQNILQDGTGRGYLAKVDSTNRLRTQTINTIEYESQSIAGEAFNINTQLVSINTTSEYPLLITTNNETRDIILQAWFAATDTVGAVGSTLGLLRAYFGATGFSGGTAVPIVNRRSGASRSWQVEALKLPTWTPSGDPVLYQTHGIPQRIFGNVFLVLPPGQSVAITTEFAGATVPYSAYAGWTGYLKEND